MNKHNKCRKCTYIKYNSIYDFPAVYLEDESIKNEVVCIGYGKVCIKCNHFCVVNVGMYKLSNITRINEICRDKHITIDIDKLRQQIREKWK